MIVILEDRYDGTYSGGRWLALRDECFIFDCVACGPNGPDTEARAFWREPRSWIAAGASPEAALVALGAKEEVE